MTADDGVAGPGPCRWWDDTVCLKNCPEFDSETDPNRGKNIKRPVSDPGLKPGRDPPPGHDRACKRGFLLIEQTKKKQMDFFFFLVAAFFFLFTIFDFIRHPYRLKWYAMTLAAACIMARPRPGGAINL